MTALQEDLAKLVPNAHYAHRYQERAQHPPGPAGAGHRGDPGGGRGGAQPKHLDPSTVIPAPWNSGPPKIAFSRFPSVHSADLEGQRRVDLTRSPTRRRITGICAHRTAGVDVERTLWIAAVESTLGGKLASKRKPRCPLSRETSRMQRGGLRSTARAPSLAFGLRRCPSGPLTLPTPLAPSPGVRPDASSRSARPRP